MTLQERMVHPVEEILKQILSEIKDLKSGQEQLREETSTINGKLDTLESKIDQLASDSQKDIVSILELQNKKLDDIREDIHSIIEVTGEHEIKIRNLSRRAI
jgi:DNA anti-recombination protein RmuC